MGRRPALAHALRDRIWAYCEAIGYDPWQAVIAMARSPGTPIEIRFMCHREVASYLLAKLKAVDLTGQVEHHHTSPALQALFAALEQQEDAERARLPSWSPPALEARRRRQSADGEWELDDDGSSPPTSARGPDFGGDVPPSDATMSWSPKRSSADTSRTCAAGVRSAGR